MRLGPVEIAALAVVIVWLIVVIVMILTTRY